MGGSVWMGVNLRPMLAFPGGVCVCVSGWVYGVSQYVSCRCCRVFVFDCVSMECFCVSYAFFVWEK